MSETIIGTSDLTYTRITPNGEEKCSLRNGVGMTIEEKLERIKHLCTSVPDCGLCLLTVGGTCPTTLWKEWTDEEIETAYDIIKGFGKKVKPVNFVKANPDDAVESECDAVESDAVNHPNHYTQNGIECITAIRASMTADGFCDYCKGNVLKYLWRWRDKGGVEDLHKARVYLDWLIEEAEK